MVTRPLPRSAMGVRKKRNLETLCSHDAAIFNAGLAVRPKNPYFVWTVPKNKRSKKGSLHIPSRLLEEYGLKIPEILVLKDEREKKWEMKITDHKDGQLYCCSRGCNVMCKVNNIDIGDKCIFEFEREGCGVLYMHMRLIKAHKFARKKGVEEEEVLQVDKESTYNNDCDESKMQKSISSCAPVRRTTSKKGVEEEEVVQIDKESTYNNDSDESDEYESNMQIQFSMAKHKLKSSSSCAPVRRSARNDNTCEGKTGVEEEENQMIDQDTFYPNLPVEEEVVQVDKESTYNNDCDESDGDEIKMQIKFSEAKHKLKSFSSCAPVRRSARLDNTFEGKTGVEEEIQKIDEDTFYSSLPKETKSDAQQRTIKKQDVHIRKLKGIIKHLITKDVNQKKSHSGTPVGSPVMMTVCLPEKLEVLQSYFELVHGKSSVSITLDDDVFGKKYIIYIFLEDINNFCLLEPISESCIIAYVWYLHRKMKNENILDRFRFVNPTFIAHMSTRTTEERACALAERLIGASTNQLVLIPCNVGFHWILTVIDLYNQTVFLLDPLTHRISDQAWKDVVDMALSMFSEAKGEKGKTLPAWVILKAPLQPDSKQCGFYIMRYMREIIEKCRDLDLNPLQSSSAKDGYSENAIDEVRVEWAEWVLEHMG